MLCLLSAIVLLIALSVLSVGFYGSSAMDRDSDIYPELNALSREKRLRIPGLLKHKLCRRGISGLSLEEFVLRISSSFQCLTTIYGFQALLYSWLTTGTTWLGVTLLHKVLVTYPTSSPLVSSHLLHFLPSPSSFPLPVFTATPIYAFGMPCPPSQGH